jgi:uncharacterized protein
MRISLFVFFLLILATIELYIFTGLKTSFGIENKKIVTILYLISILTFVTGILLFILNFKNSGGNLKILSNIIFGIGFSFFIAKLFLATVFLGEDVFRSIKFVVEKIIMSDKVYIDMRRGFIAKSGLIIALIPFMALSYGVVKGKYDFKIHTKQLVFQDLPQSFSGLKIVQISDLHLGSFDDISEVEAAVDKICAL